MVNDKLWGQYTPLEKLKIIRNQVKRFSDTVKLVDEESRAADTSLSEAASLFSYEWFPALKSRLPVAVHRWQHWLNDPTLKDMPLLGYAAKVYRKATFQLLQEIDDSLDAESNIPLLLSQLEDALGDWFRVTKEQSR